jgi:hypothetical protein
MFNAEVVADSVNPENNRITSMKLVYPRFIHSELMTHCALARNAASSRAIPTHKVLEQVRKNPAEPVQWGSNQKGMTAGDEIAGIEGARFHWKQAAIMAANECQALAGLGVHKQVTNRIVEPFVHMNTLVTATEWHNFFGLRAHAEAQPEFQVLAYLMLDKYLASSPKPMRWGEWHLPFRERMPHGLSESELLKVVSARVARVSYANFDGVIDPTDDFRRHDDLVKNGHWSPLEHPAKATPGRHAKYFGWISYRHDDFAGLEQRFNADLPAIHAARPKWVTTYLVENGLVLVPELQTQESNGS